MSDPAGWYPDPTTRHELRYWDGYTWLDNVSDKGAASNDPLGGKPMPAPSEAAARAQQPSSPSAPKSKTPLYLAIGGVALVVVLIIGFLATRDSGGGGAKAVTTLKDQPVTLKDKGTDPNHPAVFPVKIPDNTVVIIDVKATDSKVIPGIIVEAQKDLVDKVNAKISDLGDALAGQLRDACANLREEDLGAKGNVRYFSAGSGAANEDLHAFTVVPIGGEFEFIPVVVDDSNNCKAGQIEMTLTPHFLDMSSVTSSDDLESTLVDDPGLQDFVSS